MSELELQASLDALQDTIGAGNKLRGFHDEGDGYRAHLARGSTNFKVPLRNYYMSKMMLIVTEAAEGAEELRHGREVDETYYVEGKPEGVPSELADIVIRAFDMADEAGFSLGEIIIEKLKFNATRGKMHGGKKI